MCGIVGAATRGEPLGKEIIAGMRDTLAHRGPDGAGLWVSPDGRVALGHRRLAIIDLSPGGCQPMAGANQHVWVSFNGEIYNFGELRQDLEQRGHTFRSTSDTEVLLAAYLEWGTECLTRLNGMFAFAVYDSRPGCAGGPRLFLARDRAGEKPLYYAASGERFLFASELKAIMRAPDFRPVMDLGAVNHYLAFGYVPGDLCMLRSVRKLPAAHALTYTLGTGDVKVWRYWALPRPRECGYRETPSGDTPIELVDRLESLLEESVRLRMVADVPVGILLSGGMDSSLVTAMAARQAGAAVRTFTITFPGSGAHDERAHAHRVASFFGTEHHELEAVPGAIDLLPRLAFHCDEPVADSSLFPTLLVSELTRRHVTVALGGDGGDELFGGYVHYTLLPERAARWSAVPRPLRRAAGGVASRWMPSLPGRSYVMAAASDLEDAVVTSTPLFDSCLRRRLLQPDAWHALGTGGLQPERGRREIWRANSALSDIDKMTRLDFQTYLTDDVLAKVDRASMAVSLEMRAPWLDPALIEFAFGEVPTRHKVYSGRRRILPRALAARILPAGFDLDRKQGFSIPLDSWLRGGAGDRVAAILADHDGTLFRKDALRTLLADQRRGARNGARLFAVALLLSWQRQFEVAEPSVSTPSGSWAA
jgi:asparagine synthase (glutamine-hydrolysing)